MRLKLLLVAPLFFFIAHANADEVDESSVTTFEDGTPAVAQEVNGNFQALINAINDNAARLASLEASNQDSNSVSGKTYQLNSIGIINRGDAANYSSTANLTAQYTFTFNSNGTFQVNGTENDAALNTDNNELTLLIRNDPVSLSGTWVQTGSTITTSEDFSFTVSADGSVIVFSKFLYGPYEDAIESESTLVIGVRTN